MVAWGALVAVLASALAIGPFNDSVPPWVYQGAWLVGVCAVFAVVCYYESGSEG
jgi:hypothetical protein